MRFVSVLYGSFHETHDTLDRILHVPPMSPSLRVLVIEKSKFFFDLP